MENYYQVLGVALDASEDEIKSRFRFLAKAYHPDRFGDAETKAQAENEMKRLNEAYTILSNPEKRQAYNAQMGFGSQRSSGAGQTGTSGQSADEQYNYRQAREMVAYLQQIGQRWEKFLTPLPELPEVFEGIAYLNQILVGLLKQIAPENSDTQNQAIIDNIDQRVMGMVVQNLFLGVEYERNGHPRQFKPVDLQIITSLPVQETIFDLFEIGKMRGRLKESEIQETGDTIARVLFLLCEASQKAGREAFKQRSGAAPSVAAQPTRAGGTQGRPAPEPQPVRVHKDSGNLGYCQSCFHHTPTRKVTFHQNIGYVFLRRYKTIEGELCADCVERYFWEMTGKTLLFGWFGMISFIVSPFILLSNLFNYFSAWDLRKHSDSLSSIASGWKTSIFMTIAVVTLLIILLPRNGNYSSNTYNSPSSSRSNASSSETGNTYVQPTPVPTRRVVVPTATKPSCALWSEVSAADKGKKLCVYGTVRKAYWGGNVYYMSFSDNPNAFRFIVLQGYYFEGVQSNCVMAEGVVKTYDKMPYIEVGENLWKCE